MPKRVPPLTEERINELRPQVKDYKVFDGKGLILVITPVGSKLWRWRFRGPDRKVNQLTLGRHPEVSLSHARELADAARQLLKSGVNPANHRDQQRLLAMQQTPETFEALARDWQRKGGPLLANTSRNILQRLEIDVFPHIGHERVTDLLPLTIVEALRRADSRGARGLARRLCSACLCIIEHGRSFYPIRDDFEDALTDYLLTLPGANLRHLTIDEFPAFVRAIWRNRPTMSTVAAIALELQLLTLVRTSELVQMRWSDVDIAHRKCVIGWDRIKPGWLRQQSDIFGYRVGLSRQATALLRDLYLRTGSGALLFPSPIEQYRPLALNTLLKAAERIGYRTDLTGRCFRRVAISVLNGSMPPTGHTAHPEIPLDHQRIGTSFVDQRKLLQQWADYLDFIKYS